VSEIRVDPLGGLRSIIATERAGRFAEQGDPFAEGNESQTPPELYAVRPDGSAADTPGWLVRVFRNRYPALEGEASVVAPDARAQIFTASSGSGAHEVIVNSARAVDSLSALSVDELALAMRPACTCSSTRASAPARPGRTPMRSFWRLTSCRR
jgi:UDPglucose--hexose-1-phosphate uridylyltransferase